ncbi:MAG: hypothetical protein WCH57_12415 [Verrucomicrobiota bacterium]
MAERLVWNQYLANQYPTGGFGSRKMPCDSTDACAVGGFNGEAPWYCNSP